MTTPRTTPASFHSRHNQGGSLLSDLTRAGYEDIDQNDELRLVRLQLKDLSTLVAAADQDFAVVGGLPDTGGTIVGVNVTVDTAPTGATAIYDVNLNGTTIYTTQDNRPTIAISGTESTEADAPENASVVNGDLIGLDCDQIGSSVAGANAGVCVRIKVKKPLDDD